MLKNIYFIFLVILFLFIASSSLAIEPFSKSANNPLTFTDNLPDWNELGRYQPSVIYENGIFKMWYTTYDTEDPSIYKIAYATSTDGTNWQRIKLLDVYPGFANHDPAILKTDTGYTLFFVTTYRGLNKFKIFKISSSDGMNFINSTLQEVLHPEVSLENSAVSAPSPIYKNGTFYLFYLCWGSQGFNICLATSTDGNLWTRCQNNNPVIANADGPSILELENKYYLFFHGTSTANVEMVESEDPLSCNMNWINRQTALVHGPEAYDVNSIVSPNVIQRDNKTYLFYSGMDQVPGWKINLAIAGQIEQTKTPVVFLPGFFGSWNKEAILHKQNVNYPDWKINPIVKEYKGITKTFENLDYQLNQDFYIFPYDWRNSLNQSAENLNSFLQQNVIPNHQNNKINLVGHSLGGLVSRIYAQKYGTQNLDAIITIGSPHLGTAQVYKAVEAGEFDKNDTKQWLAQKIILRLNQNNKKSNQQLIDENIPVLKDLFPIYNFLYGKMGEISIQNLQIKNITLLNYNTSITSIFPALQTLVGEKGNTLSGYNITSRTNKDKLLDLYPDGRPVASIYQTGDYVINSLSAKQDTDFRTLNLDHNELVYKTDGIKEILSTLQIPYLENQIVEGSPTKILPSIIFLILSPAAMEVQFANQTYQEQEGIVFIDNAETGIYTLKVTGQEPGGKYTVLIGGIAQNQDSWSKLDGYISQIPASSQTDTYSINFDPQNPLDFPVNQDDVLSLFELFISKLNLIAEDINSNSLQKAINDASEAKNSYIHNDLVKLRRLLINIHRNVFQAFDNSLDSTQQQILEAVIQLENLYDRSLEEAIPKPSQSFLTNELMRYKKTLSSLEESLIRQKAQGKNVLAEANLLLLADEKLTKAESALHQQNLDYAENLLASVKAILK